MKKRIEFLIASFTFLIVLLFTECGSVKKKNNNPESNYRLVLMVAIKQSSLKDTLTIEYISNVKEEPELTTDALLVFLKQKSFCKCKIIATNVAYYKILSNEIY